MTGPGEDALHSENNYHRQDVMVKGHWLTILFTLGILMLGGILSCQQHAAGRGFLPWEELENPVYRHEGWSTKDACMVYKDGTFYLFFSAFFQDEGRERSHVVEVKTRDFRHYSKPLFIRRGEEDGWIGMASPNISTDGGRYYLTYNSWGDKDGQPNQLFYAVSNDLEHWEKDKPLAKNQTQGVRAIDAAATSADGRMTLAWKKRQTPQISRADNFESREWHNLGDPGLGWFENGEFIQLDDHWYLLATAGAGHLPNLARMQGTGDSSGDWLGWSDFRTLRIPAQQGFNTHDRANAGFLADWRQYDGYYYLLYAGNTEGETHAGRGDNTLGLARSKDLKTWVPAGAVSER